MSSLKPKIIIPNGLCIQTQTIFVLFISSESVVWTFKQTDGALQIYCKIERENSAREEIEVMFKEKVIYRLAWEAFSAAHPTIQKKVLHSLTLIFIKKLFIQATRKVFPRIRFRITPKFSTESWRPFRINVTLRQITRTEILWRNMYTVCSV